MDRRMLMGLLDDVTEAASACGREAERTRSATCERHGIAQRGYQPRNNENAWTAFKDGPALHEADIHAALDRLRASIDRLQGLVAELPRLDLPARPDQNVR